MCQQQEDSGDLDNIDKMLDPGTRHLMQQRKAHRLTTYQQLEDNIRRSQAKQGVVV
jgi:hypothetical protein